MYTGILALLLLGNVYTEAPSLHAVDEIELEGARYHVVCGPQFFGISMDDPGTSVPGKAQKTSYILTGDNHVQCKAGGYDVEAWIRAMGPKGGGGFCAGAPSATVDVVVNGKRALHGRFAEYCTATGVSSVALDHGRLNVCGFGSLPDSHLNAHLAGCVDYGPVDGFIGANLQVAGTPFLVQTVESDENPADIAAYLERYSLCNHWAGEEPYDAERAKEIQAAMKQECVGHDATLARLRKKYAAQPALIEPLLPFGELGY